MKTSKEWVVVNLILLTLYLLFFHLCLGAESSTCITYGFIFSAATLAVCFKFKAVFKNRYEFLFYTVLALDIFIEGFIPLHEGYSFYGCAAGFWTVFLLYHFTGTNKFKCLCGSDSDSTKEEHSPLS